MFYVMMDTLSGAPCTDQHNKKICAGTGAIDSNESAPGVRIAAYTIRVIVYRSVC